MKRRRSRKRPRRREVDRISHLPDDLLVQILSLLDIKDAVRTTSLSRGWRRRCLWVHVYNLSFQFSSGPQIPRWSLTETLDLHAAPKVNRFSLCIQHGKFQFPMVAQLIRFALTRNVEALNLHLPAHPFRVMSSFHLPPLLSSIDSLRELTTDGCDISLGMSRVNWASLRVLDVGFASLLRFENVLSGCPSLESLTLRYVSLFGGRNIDITQNKLKTLIIQQPRYLTYEVAHYNNVPDPEVRVATPQLEELELLGCWRSITWLMPRYWFTPVWISSSRQTMIMRGVEMQRRSSETRFDKFWALPRVRLLELIVGVGAILIVIYDDKNMGNRGVSW